MKVASFQDAVTIGRLLNVNKDEVWKIIKGVAYSSLTDLSFLVHRTFKSDPAEAAGPFGRKEAES